MHIHFTYVHAYIHALQIWKRLTDLSCSCFDDDRSTCVKGEASHFHVWGLHSITPWNIEKAFLHPLAHLHVMIGWKHKGNNHQQQINIKLCSTSSDSFSQTFQPISPYKISSNKQIHKFMHFTSPTFPSHSFAWYSFVTKSLKLHYSKSFRWILFSTLHNF